MSQPAPDPSAQIVPEDVRPARRRREIELLELIESIEESRVEEPIDDARAIGSFDGTCKSCRCALDVLQAERRGASGASCPSGRGKSVVLSIIASSE
jgi:hypothetical protein